MNFSRFLGTVLLVGGLHGTPASALPAGDLGERESGLVVQVRGCHGDIQRHFVPEYGRTMYHRHRRPDCRPIPVQPPQARDCHREVRRHYLPRYGNVPHRHIGPNCRVKLYSRYDPYRPRPGACIQIGPIRYCEY